MLPGVPGVGDGARLVGLTRPEPPSLEPGWVGFGVGSGSAARAPPLADPPPSVVVTGGTLVDAISGAPSAQLPIGEIGSEGAGLSPVSLRGIAENS